MAHMKTRLALILALVVLPIAIVCNFPPTINGADADEKAVRDADDAWSKAASSKDVDKTVSFYADDALVLPPNEPAVSGKDKVHELWKGFLDSVTEMSWKATRVEMAKSGDMACLTGTYEMTMKDGSKDHGKYCEVWEKKGGAWKCGTDMFSSDLPAPGTPPAGSPPEKK